MIFYVGNEFQLKGGKLRIVDINEEGDIFAELYIMRKNKVKDIIKYDYVSKETILSILNEGV